MKKKQHLAILTPGWIELILDGSKTIESRFTKVRCAPFGKVDAGDSVYMKESGGLVKGQFMVAKVETFENLSPSETFNIFEKYQDAIFATAYPYYIMKYPPEKWLASKHATLIHVQDATAFPKRDPRAWVVLNAPIGVGVRNA